MSLPARKKGRSAGRGRDSNWSTVTSLLADAWRPAAKSLGALRRRRNIRNPSQLLRTLLIYLTGSSLREAVAIAHFAGIAQLSDMALLKRLRNAVPWLRWLATGLLKCSGPELHKPDWLQGFNVKCVDATVVCKPGSSGTDWRLHFSFGLFDMGFEEFQITDNKTGESLRNFAVKPGDLLLGDRGYAHLDGMSYVIEQSGDFIVRLGCRSFTLRDPRDQRKIDLVRELASLRVGEVRAWQVFGRTVKGKTVAMRVCATRLPRPEARKAQRAARRKATRKGERISKEALRFQRYVVVATSVSEERLSAEQVLKLYRMRWQIELAIKRLKTIIGASELPCRNRESGLAWLKGKLVLALLVQALCNRGQELQLVAGESTSAESDDIRRHGNLWREMRVVLIIITGIVNGAASRRWHSVRWRVLCQILEERPRKRVTQHELLFS
jgi:hypothetical protein